MIARPPDLLATLLALPHKSPAIGIREQPVALDKGYLHSLLLYTRLSLASDLLDNLIALSVYYPIWFILLSVSIILAILLLPQPGVEYVNTLNSDPVPLEQHRWLGRFNKDQLYTVLVQGHLAGKGAGYMLRTKKVLNVGKNIFPEDTETELLEKIFKKFQTAENRAEFLYLLVDLVDP
ncbi:hypothetical protein BDV26DRAFT_299099 [Aspergillus bertholletiae]|uniref:Uncharacterized protein n=1 Tax=Aspergillus bertholletiae TaxID=1226010 RepID=A0A5N7AQ48_9EURO|nr:hypothetical protein BDV26DRAFT_299099 [Aspergillus bertholletiae]